MEGLHPVTGEQEISIHIEITAVIAAHLNAELCHDSLLIQVRAGPAESWVAEVTRILALFPHIVYIVASLLIRTDHRVVTVDAGRYARPDTFTVVAALDELLASRQGVVHCLALAVVKNSGPGTVPASHRPVVLVLGIAISKTVTNKYSFQVNVSFLV